MQSDGIGRRGKGRGEESRVEGEGRETEDKRIGIGSDGTGQDGTDGRDREGGWICRFGPCRRELPPNVFTGVRNRALALRTHNGTLDGARANRAAPATRQLFYQLRPIAAAADTTAFCALYSTVRCRYSSLQCTGTTCTNEEREFRASNKSIER